MTRDRGRIATVKSLCALAPLPRHCERSGGEPPRAGFLSYLRGNPTAVPVNARIALHLHVIANEVKQSPGCYCRTFIQGIAAFRCAPLAMTRERGADCQAVAAMTKKWRLPRRRGAPWICALRGGEPPRMGAYSRAWVRKNRRLRTLQAAVLFLFITSCRRDGRPRRRDRAGYIRFHSGICRAWKRIRVRRGAVRRPWKRPRARR